MSLAKNMRLIDLLLMRTQAGLVDWQESFSNGFQVSFKDNSVRIISSEAGGSLIITVLLLNDSGEVVDTFTDEELDAAAESEPGGPWFIKMKELSILALRHARGADKVLNAILKELDDDIPF